MKFLRWRRNGWCRIESISVLGIGLTFRSSDSKDPTPARGGDAEVGIDGVAMAGAGGGPRGGQAGPLRSVAAGLLSVVLAVEEGREDVAVEEAEAAPKLVVGTDLLLAARAAKPGRLIGAAGAAPKIAGVPTRQVPDGSWLWDYGRGGSEAPLPPADKPREDPQIDLSPHMSGATTGLAA